MLFNDLPARCEQYDNALVVTRKSARGWFNSRVCPTIRATWPVPWLWDLSNAALGWMSYDATPSSAWVADGSPGNCEVPDQTDWFCAGLGVGFVLLEIITPLILLYLLFPLVLAVVKVIRAGVGFAGGVLGVTDADESKNAKNTKGFTDDQDIQETALTLMQ